MLRAGNYSGHAGLTFGYNTQFLRDPQTDTTIAVLTGLALAPDGRLPIEPLTAAVVDQLAHAAPTDRPTPTTTG